MFFSSENGIFLMTTIGNIIGFFFYFALLSKSFFCICDLLQDSGRGARMGTP